jgi:hypothetical protein
MSDWGVKVGFELFQLTELLIISNDFEAMPMEGLN